MLQTPFCHYMPFYIHIYGMVRELLDFHKNINYWLLWISSYLLFFYLGSLSRNSRFTGQQGKGEAIFLSPLHLFHPLHRHLGISRVITAESSPLHIASSRTRTGTFGFWAQVAKLLPSYLQMIAIYLDVLKSLTRH